MRPSCAMKLCTLTVILAGLILNSCNDQLPVGPAGIESLSGSRIDVLPSKALEYPLSVGTVWVYRVQEVASRIPSSGDPMEPDTSHFIATVSVIRRYSDREGEWALIEERTVSSDPHASPISFVRRYEYAYRNGSLYTRQAHIARDSIGAAVAEAYAPPPFRGVVYYLSIEFPDFGPAVKQAEMRAGSVTTPAGVFDSCGLYSARYDNSRSLSTTPTTLETVEIVKPGIGLVLRTERMTSVFTGYRVTWKTSKELLSVSVSR